MTPMSHQAKSLRIVAAGIVGIESTTALVSAVDMGTSGSFVTMSLAPVGLLVAYAVWMANAALTILRGTTRPGILAVTLVLAVLGTAMGASDNEGLTIFGPALAGVLLVGFILLPFQKAEPKVQETPEPMRYSRFPRQARQMQEKPAH